MKALVTTCLTLLLFWLAPAQTNQAQSAVTLVVQPYLNVRFDGSRGGEHDLLLIVGAPGKRAFQVQRGFTATANLPFLVQSHLLAIVPHEQFWSVDVDDAMGGAQRSLSAPAGIRRSTLTVTVQVPHGKTPVLGAVLLTISPQ
ncbi:MAG: hypothetical protein KatS3mg015_2305 [Fimbriimonadales bacterium]|nr:MAG: hypothetical protein KatS3mg015_2305 [Fimbriimonadales bacterium]